MVGRRRKNRTTRPLAGNHQRCWIWGRNAVLQALKSGRWLPVRLLAADRTDAAFRAILGELATAHSIPVDWVSYDALTDRCQSTEHQGLMAMMPEFTYAELSEDLLATQAGQGAPFFVVLDGIQDPFNFGAIIRSAEVLGATAIIVGERGQCGVTPHVARASAGAVNDLPIVQVSEVTEALDWLKARQVRILGTSGYAQSEIAGCDLTGPTCLVIGNEGAGLSESLQAACDQLVRIPQIGRTESLNAAVAAGILCYEVRRQRSATSSDHA